MVSILRRGWNAQRVVSYSGLLVVALFLAQKSFGQILLSEDFSTTFETNPPTGWDHHLFEGDSTLDYWSFDDPYVLSPLSSPSSGRFATFSGYYYSDNGIEERAAITSPWVSIGAMERDSVFLQLYHYYFFEGVGGNLSIQAQGPAGGWVPIYEHTQGEAQEVPEKLTLNLTATLGWVDSLRIQLVGSGNGNLAWVVDDFVIAQGSLSPPRVDHTPPSNTCDFKVDLMATSPAMESIDRGWLVYSLIDVDGVADTIPFSIQETAEASIRTANPSRIAYRLIFEDNSANQNLTYSPAFDRWHQVVVGGIVPEEAGTLWHRRDGLFTRVGDLNHHIGETGPFRFPLYTMDSTSPPIEIITYPVTIGEELPYLAFNRAYSGYGEVSDTLRFHISTDGGKTWQDTPYESAGTRLQTVPNQLEPYEAPLASDWRRDGVSLSRWVNQCIQVKIEIAAGFGNNLYLDSLRFTTEPETQSFAIHAYPNPTSQYLTVESTSQSSGPSWIGLYSMRGRLISSVTIPTNYGGLVHTLDLSGHQAGPYIVRVSDTQDSASLLIVLE